MTEEIIETEVQKAEKVLQEAEKAKQEAFAKELNELCEKHGYSLQVQANIVLQKK